ncbi:MAG: Xaa-Pro dipeptidase [Gammaproteobacteria bacterium]|nr:Xaa-Pro dipeptidase [Gammaproteobacteria bacterium]MDH3373177.1 Xaa-Pro dipeptidase [Gammaproteobacteria bacterium]MDH3410199.1 Xaa-Pro dipeptidase [Gammaproteobacteria bacterium]
MSDDYSDKNPSLGIHYPAHIQELSARHDRALASSGASHVVIFSGCPKVAFLDDFQYPFKPNAHFLGWAPLTNLPLSYIVYSPGEAPRIIYYLPHDYWHPVPGQPDGYWTGSFDIRIVHSIEDVGEHLPDNRDQCILIGEIDDPAHAFGIERINPTSAINILHYARGVKTDYEVACMRLASRRGARGHVAAEAAFRDGLTEFEIHQAYCQAVSQADNELPYSNIIALNAHGAILHYTDLDRQPPEETRSFLIDAGAQVHGYASDITRTYSFNDMRFAALVERMDTTQLEIVSKVRAGVDYRELHVDAHRMLAGVLVDAGLATGDPDTLLETGVTSAFFPHGLGHLLGVQVHDAGGFMENEAGLMIDPPSGHPFLRLTRVLKENMVLTIEPGIYAIDMLLENLRGTPAEHHVIWDGVDWLRPFGGIRIEDDVRVMADGCENLTRDAFAAVH